MKNTSKSLIILRFFSVFFHFAQVSDCIKKSGNSFKKRGGGKRFAQNLRDFQKKNNGS